MYKVRAAVTERFTLLSADTGAIVSSTPVASGTVLLLTAEQIYAAMSKEPQSLMLMNPTAPSLSSEEKGALNELYSLFLEGAEGGGDNEKRNCLEVLSSPFGLLHPRREEGVRVLKGAVSFPGLEEFAQRLIKGSIVTLEASIGCGHEETELAARKLIGLFKGN
jgi:hypothetical protein